MMITDKINFKQPKYVLPAILYPLLLISGYLIFDIFDTEPAETGNTLQTTEFLNPELPQARVDNNGGIDGKYESMVKSYGRIQDFSAVENIERNNNKDDKEAYESKYTEDDLALLDMEADKRTEELERVLRPVFRGGDADGQTGSDGHRCGFARHPRRRYLRARVCQLRL